MEAVCAVGCPPPDDIPETVSMRIDRPFGFAIRGDYNQLLFMGVVKDMKKNQL
jgi:serpin B